MKIARMAIVAIALVASAWPALSQERVAFEGTAVTAVLPEGFVPMPDGKPGYMDMKSIAGVSAMQTPPALYDQLDAAKLEQQAREIIRQLGLGGDATRETLTVGDREYLLISSEMEMAGFPTTMWLVIADREASFMLSMFQAKVPTGEPVLDRAAVLDVLASIEVGAPLTFDDQVAALGYRVIATDPFRYKTVLGPMVVLATLEDRTANLNAPEVMITRPPFAQGIPIDEIGVNQLTTFGEHHIKELKAATFGGAEGKRLQGEIRRHGIAETFVMYFAYVGDAPLVLFASGDAKDMDAAMIKVIDGIAASVERLEN